MAELTAARNNVLAYPVYGLPYVATFPILDADGDLVTGAAGLDSEVSKNCDTFADCTNESTEIATSSGIYYLSLTATEMAADVVTVIVKTSTTGAKTTTLTLYPVKLPSLLTGTATAGAAGTITLANVAASLAVDDYFNGCLLYTTGGTGSGQARRISDYVGSTRVASVNPQWATTPDNTTTYEIYLTDTAVNALKANVSAISDDATAADNLEAYCDGTTPQPVNTTLIAGSAVSTSTAQIGVNVIQAAGTAWGSGAITAGAIASSAITSAKFASGAITATVIAADAIGASELAADAVTEIVTGVWNAATASYGGAGTYGQAVEDVLADTNELQTAITDGGRTDLLIDAIKAKTDSLNFTGTDVKATLDGETVTVGTNNDKTGYTVSTVSDKTGYSLAADQAVNVTKFNGTTVTARDIGASVLLSNGTGTGQISLSSGQVTVGTLASAAIASIWNALTSGLTTAGSIGKLLVDNINATISSRSTYAGGDTSGTTTLLSRIASALTITSGKVDVNDKTGFSLSTAGIAAIWDALTSGMSTAGSIGKRIVDYLTGDIFARLGAPAGASVSADIAAAKSDTAASKAVTDKLDTAMELDGAVYRFTMNALERAPSTLGPGAITWTYTVTDGVNPIEGVDVWVTSDISGTITIARGTTNASGIVTFYLDAGTVYVWSQKSGYSFSNPDTEVVS